jgi:hypothetical protein
VGKLDELRIHLVPVLLANGTSLFEPTGQVPIDLEHTRVIESPEVLHLTYRFNNSAGTGHDRNIV